MSYNNVIDMLIKNHKKEYEENCMTFSKKEAIKSLIFKYRSEFDSLVERANS